MQFVDEATIQVMAGNGGDGIVSFRRESHVALGGPDGGSGGRGGHVILEASGRVVTLMDHRYKRCYNAEAGVSGGPQGCTGKAGDDLVIPVPVGTIVQDHETGAVLVDLATPGLRYVVVSGGKGGRGNTTFTSSTRRAPRIATKGMEGQACGLNLSLKLVADVGLVGLPNAGKSTLIRSLTRSQARVAAYPFTTLVPNLGVCHLEGHSFVIADIPGLVEGAHEGVGLGDRFLKHVERTRVLVHLIALGGDPFDPVEAYGLINTELARHSNHLTGLKQVVVLNKIDLLDDSYEHELWTDAFREKGIEVFFISALKKDGVKKVAHAVSDILRSLDDDENSEQVPWSPI
jgi:GTP-binding protein